jgi:hypothetical protein
MSNFHIMQRLDNGARVEVCVVYREHLNTFIIEDARYIEKGKRSGIWLCGSQLTNEYTYRRLSMEDRRKREMEEILKYVPVDVLNAALIGAWESTKPKMLEEV